MDKKIIYVLVGIWILAVVGVGWAYFKESQGTRGGGVVPEPPAVTEPGIVTKAPVEVPIENGDDRCGMVDCHGMDIICGSGAAGVCTMEYQIGDKCRQFAQCGLVDGDCQLIESSEFESCKACVEKCIADFGDSSEVFECEANCGE